MKRFIFISVILLLLSGCEKDEVVIERINNKKSKDYFFFIMNNSELYRYNLSEKVSEKIWQRKNEKIIELSSSKNGNGSFFFTAKDFGENDFPFIKQLKIYMINDDSSVTLIDDPGDVQELFTRWENENNIRIFINKIDPGNPKFIKQTRFIYNTLGKKLLEEEEIFDLITQGYPIPAGEGMEYNSPSGNLLIDTSGNRITLNFLKENTDRVLAHNSSQINSIRWSDDEEYLFILLPDFQNQDNKLLFYTLKDKTVKKVFEQIKYFYITGSYLVYDKESGKNSTLFIYNFEDDKLIDSISNAALSKIH